MGTVHLLVCGRRDMFDSTKLELCICKERHSVEQAIYENCASVSVWQEIHVRHHHIRAVHISVIRQYYMRTVHL